MKTFGSRVIEIAHRKVNRIYKEQKDIFFGYVLEYLKNKYPLLNSDKGVSIERLYVKQKIKVGSKKVDYDFFDDTDEKFRENRIGSQCLKSKEVFYDEDRNISLNFKIDTANPDIVKCFLLYCEVADACDCGYIWQDVPDYVYDIETLKKYMPLLYDVVKDEVKDDIVDHDADLEEDMKDLHNIFKIYNII